MKRLLVPTVLLLAASSLAAQEKSVDQLDGQKAKPITRIWLTDKSNDPSKLVVNWMTDESGDSVVRFGLTGEDRQVVRIDENTTLHHVEVPLNEKDTVYHYSVSTGNQSSSEATFKAYPTDVLRVTVIANWQGRPDLSAILKDDPHLLLTAGDNISSIHGRCGTGMKDCVTPYAELIDAYPKLFRSVPFMPALGNHDREIRPRGDQPPEEPVYDIEAAAFRRFFELPDDEWKWRFDVAEFGVRFVALDFNHISDFGTTWQSCHAFDENSEQFRWYEKLMEKPQPFVVTLYNERNASIRNQAKGKWHDLFRKGTVCITGFGHFGERAELDGVTYYNTSFQGRGNRYPDPHSKFLASENNYVLLTFDRAARKMAAEIKGLDGKVLDRKEHKGDD